MMDGGGFKSIVEGEKEKSTVGRVVDCLMKPFTSFFFGKK